jgi:hypothetical protein
MIHTIPLDQTFVLIREWLPHFLTFAKRRNSQAIWQAINDGEVQIHLVKDGSGSTVAAVGTRVFDHPEAGRVGDIVWAGGSDLKTIISSFPEIEAFLGRQGCRRIIMTGRLSLARVFAPLGYAPTQITLEKSLER